MHTAQITHSVKSEGPPRISHVAGVAFKQPFTLVIGLAVEAAESGLVHFYTVVDGFGVNLVPARGPDGQCYLKGEFDGASPDALLQLPDFPPPGNQTSEHRFVSRSHAYRTERRINFHEN